MNGNLRMYRDFKQRGTKNIPRKMFVSRPKFKEQIPSCSGRKLISAKKKKVFKFRFGKTQNAESIIDLITQIT